ncbi:Hypothetical protein I595_1717 [Croceitalea dokdonensis DOKDO 023]|uniref:Uncharacterized protein n=1 Tax=Croceitalea dokdonensis DOKDO 023 TaxID=1300341 RepID=A0A0N8H410_9FLAO|nr:Hypothetical protein I595_1717 [Croceitalea dokdonensis DOKDO 023]
MNIFPISKGHVAMTPGKIRKRTFFLVSSIKGSILVAPAKTKYNPNSNPNRK